MGNQDKVYYGNQGRTKNLERGDNSIIYEKRSSIDSDIFTRFGN